LTYSISPNQGYAISQVYVDGIGQGALSSYTFSGISASHTILATFTMDLPSTYTIITAAGSGGSISPSGDITVNRGSDKLFSITADSGYRISNVSVDGIAKGAITSYTFYDVISNHTIVAMFTSNPTSPTSYSITASADTGGSISPNGTSSVSEGDSLTYTIVPSHGYSISEVYIDGVAQGPLSSYSFNNIVKDHTIFATFDMNLPTTYTIIASAGTGGSISPTGNIAVSHGANITFSISANSGYRISNVKVNGVNKGAINSYTFTNVIDNQSIIAEFSVFSADIQALSVSMAIESSWPRNTHPKDLVFSFKNKGPTVLNSHSYRADIYLSKNNQITVSDIKIGEYILSSINLGVNQTLTEFAEISLLNRITIPSNIAWGEYYTGLHLVPLGGSPSDANSSNNWVTGNTVMLPLEFGLDNNSSYNISTYILENMEIIHGVEIYLVVMSTQEKVGEYVLN
ncbi:MAG: hypothetical protein GXY60_11100, partial [Spirochaetales bacterium]|nr:hypothetical protein [Spirochaetales bacterium]